MPEIIDRKMAIALGLKKYFTGKPCCRGHMSDRRVAGGACLSCEQYKYSSASDVELHRRRTYYADNIEKMKEYRKKYYADNSTRILDRTRSYQTLNKEKIRDRKRAYRATNADSINERRRIQRLSTTRVNDTIRNRQYSLKRAAIMQAFKQLGITIPEIENVAR